MIFLIMALYFKKGSDGLFSVSLCSFGYIIYIIYHTLKLAKIKYNEFMHEQSLTYS